MLARGAAAQEEEVGKPFWVSTPPGATAALQSVTAAIARSDWDGAARALQTVFDKFPVSFAESGRTGAYAGARHRAARLLATAPKAVRDAYERMFGGRAEEALRQALRASDRGGLVDVVRRYEPTAAGLRAILSLADLALLRGRPAEARLLLARVALLHPVAATGDAVTKRRALAAARDHAEGGPAPAPAEQAPDTPRLPSLLSDAWPVLGGNATRNRRATAVDFHPVHRRHHVNVVQRRYDHPPRPNANFPWRQTRHFYADWEERWKDYAPVHPVVARGFLVYHDGRQVTARNLFTGELAWRYPREVEIELLGRTNLNNVFSPVIADGVVYAAIERTTPFLPQTLQGVPITYYLPQRRLVALDLETGEIRWEHDEAWFQAHPGNDELRRLSVTGAPVVRGDHVYAGACYSEGTFHSFVIALDRHTGEPEYVTRICSGQQELNLFGRQLQECSPTPVTEVDGVLYVGTNLGIVAAVDALLGVPLWAVSYRFVPIPSTYYWFEAPRRWPRFDNSPPLVVGDQVVVAPPDGTHVLSLDRRSGRTNWRIPRRIPAGGGLTVRTPQAADGERVYLSGSGGVVALWLHDRPERGTSAGDVAWHCEFLEDNLGAGRGLLAENGLWIPTYGAIYQIDEKTGRVLGFHEREGNDRYDAIHLAWGDGVLVTAGREFVATRFDPAGVAARARQRIREHPDEVGPLLAAGDIHLATKDVNQAIDHYRRARVWAEARGVPAVARRAQHGLHRALLLRAEQTLETEPAKAPAEFERAFRAAPDARTRIRARRQLDRWLDAGPAGEAARWRLRNLRTLEREHGPAALGEGARTVRGWALREIAGIHAETGDVKRALAVLHELIESDPSGEDGRYASRRIRALIERHGRQAYAPYERRARELFDSALRSDDLEALERGLRIYANAGTAPAATLELARRRLDARDPSSAVRVLQRFLLERAGDPRVPEALTLMARGLDARHSYGLAYATLLRLKTRHPDALVPRADGARVPARELAAEWLRRDRYRSLARSARRRDLEPNLGLRFERAFANTSFLDVPDLLGQRPEALPEVVVVRAHTRAHVLDARNGDALFHVEFGSYEPKGPLVFVGNRFHGVTDRFTYVFDATTGTALRRWPVPRDGRAERLLEHQGQVFLLFRSRRQTSRIGVAALHPDDGSVLWSRYLEGRNGERATPRYHAEARGDHLLLFATNPITVTVLDSTSGAVENRIVVDRRPRTNMPTPPLLLPDGRVLLGTVTAEQQRFEFVHSYAVHLVDPMSPPEGALLWRYRSRDDGENRYLHHLTLAGDYVAALDEKRGTAVLDVRTGKEVNWTPQLPVAAKTGEPFLDTAQPHHDSLLLVLTRSGSAAPALLSAYELPDLRRKYSVALTDSAREVARLIEAQGVVGVSVGPSRGRFAQPRIRLFDPVDAEKLQELAPPARVTWLNAKVQNGILLVTTNTNTLYAYGPR